MRLRRLGLKDVAGVAAGELVVPLEGPCVVHAPNEEGKSTLFRAYRLVVEGTNHRSGARPVKALQTVGSDVGTTVEVELVLGDETHRAVRTYNKHVGSTLTVTGPAGTRELKGDEADEHLADRIAARVDTTLLALLTLEQGRTLKPLDVASSPSIEAALRAADADGAAGDADGDAAGVTHGGDDLLDAVRARVKAAFHAKTGKPSGALKKQADRLAAAVARHDDAVAALAALHGDAEDAEGAAERIAALRTTLTELDAELTAARQAERVAKARAEAALADGRRATRAKAVAAVADLAAKAEQQRTAVATATAERDDAAKALGAAEQAAARATAARAELAAAVVRAEADLVAALDAAVAAGRAQLKDERVDAAAAKEVDRLVRTVDAARAGLRSGSWTVTVEARRDVTLTVDGEEVAVAQGATHRGDVAAGVTWTDTDGTVVTVEADEARRQQVGTLAADEAALSALLERLGAADPDEVERRLAARRELEGRIDELAERAAEVREDSAADELPAPRPAAGSDAEPIAALEEALEAAVAALDAAGDATDPVAAATTALEKAAALLEVQVGTLTARTDEHDRAAQELAAARAETPDEALEADATAAEAALAAVLADGEGAPGDVAALEARRTAADADLKALEQRAHARDAQQRSAAAFEASRAAAEQDLADERQDWDRALGEAEAARRLRDRLEAARAAQGDRYREPLVARIGALLSDLYGHPCRVEVDDDLRIVRRSEPDGRMVPWDQLSGGAREQAAIATGLAIAELAGDGGVPFWIDDAIVFTDDVRLEGLKRLLAATTAQVIVLTCRPELAAGLPPAEVVLTRG